MAPGRLCQGFVSQGAAAAAAIASADRMPKL
jgi:hypothetical protein